jgi:hypothetical protein
MLPAKIDEILRLSEQSLPNRLNVIKQKVWQV